MKKMKKLFRAALCVGMILFTCAGYSKDKKKEYNTPYSGHYLDRVSFPIGGMGTGMYCIDGNGMFSHMSPWHTPALFNEPGMFGAIHIKGVENGSRKLEGVVRDWQKWGRRKSGAGVSTPTAGFPGFSDVTFTGRFPFADLSLKDAEMPVDVNITAWNPFIPTDQDNSSLPVGGMEYTFTNTSGRDVEAVFSFHSRNFMARTQGTAQSIEPMPNGFVLTQRNGDKPLWEQGEFAIYTDEPGTVVNHCWFRGAWFDPMTATWNDITGGVVRDSPPAEGAPGASLYVPFKLKKGESKTIRLYTAWFVPQVYLNYSAEAETDDDRGNFYDPADYADLPPFFEPWYAHRFGSLKNICDYWLANYDELKRKTRLFTDAFYDSTLPPEVVEAVAANLSILKSPTIMRQHDGRMWNWEGCDDDAWFCHGSCTHVWNYAQAIPHLFPEMERSLRETEFFVGQSKSGHQVFRQNIPIRPVRHDFHAASDGQLGGIVKVYREWRISGDDEWLRRIYPQAVESIEYCIRTWDPREAGALEEPHHNTYDIEFWGPDGMCTGFYAAALQGIIAMGEYLDKDVSRYRGLLDKSRAYMSEKLFDGEYFFQEIRWRDLCASGPDLFNIFRSIYSPEAFAVFEKEGPKYQYGTGCISDGVLGGWMALTAGLEDPLDQDKVRSHLHSVYKYNFRKDLLNHINPQRTAYALGDDGGLLLCSWPKGGKPTQPFVYSNEVWTGIEYQVAAHLIFMGDVDMGLEIVRTVRDRYDGRVRNPYNEYECGSWYGRALSSYSLLQALTGVRYDAVEKTLYADSKIGNFRSFICTDTGFGTVVYKKGRLQLNVVYGEIDAKHLIAAD